MDNPYEFLGGEPEQTISSTFGIFIYVESYNDQINEESLSAIGKARELADMLGTGIGGVILNSANEDVAQQMGYVGIDKVFLISGDKLIDYDMQFYCEQLSYLIKSNEPEILLSGESILAIDFLPRLAQRLKTGLITGCSALEIDTMDRIVLATRPAYENRMNEVHVCLTARPQIILLKPSTFPMPIVDNSRQCVIEKF